MLAKKEASLRAATAAWQSVRVLRKVRGIASYLAMTGGSSLRAAIAARQSVRVLREVRGGLLRASQWQGDRLCELRQRRGNLFGSGEESADSYVQPTLSQSQCNQWLVLAQPGLMGRIINGKYHAQ